VHETAADNLAEYFHRSSFLMFARGLALRRFLFTASIAFVNEQEEIPPKRTYQWPWFVLAGVVLFVVLAIVWVSVAVKRERQQRDFNAPLPVSPAR
jgi:drug/metabolite transporter (DMT)-like permease